jgi:signal transduction histidine kinase
MLRVEVQDFGSGLSESDKEHLFVAFAQLRPGDLMTGRGSGLGLA